jgi:hypothetical protein
MADDMRVEFLEASAGPLAAGHIPVLSPPRRDRLALEQAGASAAAQNCKPRSTSSNTRRPCGGEPGRPPPDGGSAKIDLTARAPRRYR